VGRGGPHGRRVRRRPAGARQSAHRVQNVGWHTDTAPLRQHRDLRADSETLRVVGDARRRRHAGPLDRGGGPGRPGQPHAPHAERRAVGGRRARPGPRRRLLCLHAPGAPRRRGPRAHDHLLPLHAGDGRLRGDRRVALDQRARASSGAPPRSSGGAGRRLHGVPGRPALAQPLLPAAGRRLAGAGDLRLHGRRGTAPGAAHPVDHLACRGRRGPVGRLEEPGRAGRRLGRVRRGRLHRHRAVLSRAHPAHPCRAERARPRDPLHRVQPRLHAPGLRAPGPGAPPVRLRLGRIRGLVLRCPAVQRPPGLEPERALGHVQGAGSALPVLRFRRRHDRQVPDPVGAGDRGDVGPASRAHRHPGPQLAEPAYPQALRGRSGRGGEPGLGTHRRGAPADAHDGDSARGPPRSPARSGTRADPAGRVLRNAAAAVCRGEPGRGGWLGRQGVPGTRWQRRRGRRRLSGGHRGHLGHGTSATSTSSYPPR